MLPGEAPLARPLIPLADGTLLINAPSEPSVGLALQAEVPSADRIDLLCAFIKWSGLRLLQPVLAQHLAAGRPLRVLTTVYLGATDRKALDWLVENKAEVRVSTDTRRTRLHADFPERFPSPGHPPLLLIAHRKEILPQALATFRQVLRDPSFGELFVDGELPRQWMHVFASVQSLAQRDLAKIPCDRFAVVIVDEFHHAAASSYRRWLDHLRPQLLLGLTATPERSDGLDILRWFGGRIASELRLWSALDQGLLAPFHYFAVADATDLSALECRRGGYVPARLSALTGCVFGWRPSPRRPDPQRAAQDRGRPTAHAGPGFLRERGARPFHGRTLPGPRPWASASGASG